MRQRFLFFVCFCSIPFLLRTQFAFTAEPRDDVSTLRELLKELRTLRQAEAEEIAAWRTEKANLELLLEQRQARLREVRANNASLQETLDTQKELHERQAAEMHSLETQSQQYRAWIKSQLKQLQILLQQHPLFASKKFVAHLQALEKETSQELPDYATRFWHALLELAALGVEPRLEVQAIVLENQTLEVDVFYFGASAAFFLSRDNRRCGLARMDAGKLHWVSLSESWLPSIRRLLQVARKDIPAELVFPVLERNTINREEAP